MLLNFTKMHGLGNDFIVVDAIRQDFKPTPELIRQWADRRTGIGFDQLLIAAPAQQPTADFFYKIFNADGSEVANCGNGARCLARFLHDEKLTTKNPLTVETLTGLLELKLEQDDLVTVNMGVPILEPAKIPFITPQQQLIYSLTVNRHPIEFCAISMGNPHAVIKVDNIDTAPVQTLGPLLTKHPVFPEGANIGFMQIIDQNNIRLRVYERGAGETLACGTGASAAVVAGNLLGKLAATVNVQQPGGTMRITWQNINAPLYLTGPAVKVFAGTISS
jgi:diaminopimelate epimerase